MQEALRRLQDLKRRLEELHKETSKVLAESHRLVGELEEQATSEKTRTVASSVRNQSKAGKRRGRPI